MHECEECGTMCDCDGEDLDQPEPGDHVCINPDCGRDVDDGEDLPRAGQPCDCRVFCYCGGCSCGYAPHFMCDAGAVPD